MKIFGVESLFKERFNGRNAPGKQRTSHGMENSMTKKHGAAVKPPLPLVSNMFIKVIDVKLL